MDFVWLAGPLLTLAITTIGLSGFAWVVLLSLRITLALTPATIEDWFNKKVALEADFWIISSAAAGFALLALSQLITEKTDLTTVFVACACILGCWARNKRVQAEKASLRKTKEQQREYDRTHNADSDDNWKPSVS